MKRALQYLSHNKVRISGYTVVTAFEAVHAVEIAAQEQKEDAVKAFCEATCGEPCAAKHCDKYQAFVDRIGYKPATQERKPPFQEQTLF